MKGKIFVIVLLFCFVAPLATTFFVLEYEEILVKAEVKLKIIAGIDRKELVLLKFTKGEEQTQLNWEHGEEFQYKGEIYDVVETLAKGDTTYYWCWWDHEETKLCKQLDDLVSFAIGNSPKNQENQNKLFEFFDTLYFSESSEKSAFALRKIDTEYAAERQRFYQSVLNSPPFPPPRIS